MLPLVILDLDGTLIGKSGKVEDCIWKAVDLAKTKGVKFVVCTGRPGFGIAQKVAERLANTLPHIFHNGAQLAYASGESIKLTALKESLSKKLVEHAREKNLTLELYTPSTLFVERKTSLSESHAKMIGVNAIVRDLEAVIEREPVIRAQWVIPKGALSKALECKPEGVTFGVASSPAHKDAYFVSVTKENVTKGEAVKTLCEQLKIPLEHVMAVGDSSGDRPMLSKVGFPMVMANAIPELHSHFPSTEKTVEDCGVIESIQIAMETTLAT